MIPPLWPLRDYVAVNPYVGLTEHPFLAAGLRLQSVRPCDFLMPKEFYRECWATGRLQPADVAAGLEAARGEYPRWFEGMHEKDITAWLQAPAEASPSSPAPLRTIAHEVDEQTGVPWSAHILNDITRHCAAHFDRGQSSWPNPWKNCSLYEAWRESSCLSRRMDLLGLSGFRTLVQSLSPDPETAVRDLLEQLAVPERLWTPFLLAQAFSVAGWAAYVRNLDQQAPSAQSGRGELLGLVAMRLAYDAALGAAFRRQPAFDRWCSDWEFPAERAPEHEIRCRYVLQLALERSYQDRMLKSLGSPASAPPAPTRKSTQFVCCIDVRSEVLRRHLESLDVSIETFGFAGFFGAALNVRPAGSEAGSAQCPVLIQPAFNVVEDPAPSAGPRRGWAGDGRERNAAGRQLAQTLKGSVTGGFSFVEAFGLAGVGRLVGRAVSRRRPALRHGRRQTTLRLEPTAAQSRAGCDSTLASLAESILRNLGLVSNFARTVVLCGHASDVVNNPYRAALACGACGGHSGEPNACFVAALLNDPAIRRRLADCGIVVPDDCQFLAAVHETTTDEVSFPDEDAIPDSHHEDLRQLRDRLAQASALCRQERSLRFAGATPETLCQRGGDWSQVRPEWGLAGNAALIVAPRSKTRGLDLGGRTFLHSYERARDPELKTLELILTAPLVVASWINLQYYASAVDPVAYGSGDKTIHNVVGNIGILQGNGGDLMTGLPWQSVHDGRQLRHEPLRLFVVVDASRADLERILQRHPQVRNLVTNGWVHLVSWEHGGFYRWMSTGSWNVASHL